MEFRIVVFFSEWNSRSWSNRPPARKESSYSPPPPSVSSMPLILPTVMNANWSQAGYLVLCDRYIFTAFARDTVRGCSQWVRGIYDFGAQPDLVFFSGPSGNNPGAHLERRPTPKYFEAGMDLNLSNDIVESFRLFQGMQLEHSCHGYSNSTFSLSTPRARSKNNSMLRQLICQHIDLDAYRKEG